MGTVLRILVALCSDIMMLSAICRLFSAAFGRSRVDRRIEYLAYGLCWLINSLNGALIGVPLCNILVTTATLLGLSCLYPGRSIGKLGWTLVVLCLPAGCEMLIYGLLVACGVPQEAMMQMGAPLSHLLLLLISLTLKRVRTPKTTPGILRLYWVSILALPLGSLALLILLCGIYTVMDGVEITLIALILLILNLLMFFVLDRLEAYGAAGRERELLMRQNRAYRAEFELMRQSERQVRALRHDMKNHLAVLRAYASQGRLEDLERYLDVFDRKLERPGPVHSGNPDVDSILNYKLGQAKEAGAKLKLDVRLPEHFAADVFDLNVILGNLLDNAVEGLAGSADKQLALALRADRGVLFLKIANSYDGVVLKTDGPGGTVYRSRRGGEDHGLGLDIVRRTVDKYHGTVRIDSSGGVFTVEAMLYLAPAG